MNKFIKNGELLIEKSYKQKNRYLRGINSFGSDLDVLSVFGSEDRVMNREKYEKYKSNLPSNFFEFEIEGGCHAYFGMYGEQKGDGVATITAEEQILKTAEYISKFIFKGE